MDALCLRRHVAFRIEVFAEGASRWHMVQQFQGGDLDDAVAGGRIEAGGFGVENDLAHHTSLFRAAPGRQALRRRSPPVRNSLTMPASWRKLCRLPRPVCTTKSDVVSSAHPPPTPESFTHMSIQLGRAQARNLITN